MPLHLSLFFARGLALAVFLAAAMPVRAEAALGMVPDLPALQPVVATDLTGEASYDASTITSASGIPAQELTAPQSEDGANVSPGEPDISSPNVDPNAPPPPVEYDLSKLPEPVRQTRERIIAAARTGSIEALRPLIGSGKTMTDFGGDADTDPIDFLKSLSGDDDGREVLAILIDILDSGYVHLNAGTPNEIYAWPYFFAYPLDKLTPRQMVELFRIMTAGDFDDMKSYGAYIFYRAGIAPDGTWRFFIAGE